MASSKEIISFSKQIGLSREDVEVILKTDIEEGTYRCLKSAFYKNPNKCLQELEKKSQHAKFILSFYTRLALDLHPIYQLKEISDAVYYDTFSDIAIWADEHKKRTGECGLSETRWLIYHLYLKLFRLGRLQFQSDTLLEKICIEGSTYPAGTICLQVHIPKGEPLAKELCEASYQSAYRFFRGFEPLFLCHSWLLSPALFNLLQPESNILNFASRYSIVKQFPEDRSAEERVFGKIEKNPKAYTCTTYLQKRMREYLIQGGRIPAALGVFRFTGKEGY